MAQCWNDCNVSGRTLGLGATRLAIKNPFHVKHFFQVGGYQFIYNKLNIPYQMATAMKK